MIWLLTRLVVWPVKLVTGTTKVTTKGAAKATSGSFKAGYRTGRVLGYRRMLVLGAGVGIGLLVAPRTGRESRELLRTRLEERGLLSPPAPEGADDQVAPPSPLPETASVPLSGNGLGGGDGEAEPPVVPLETLPEDPTTGGLT